MSIFDLDSKKQEAHRASRIIRPSTPRVETLLFLLRGKRGNDVRSSDRGGSFGLLRLL